MYRGHRIIFLNDKWVYEDISIPISEQKNRECGHCGLSDTKEGHDGCLGTLPNVKNACCGHGNVGEAYIQYWDNTDVRGQIAKLEQERILDNNDNR